MKKHKIAFEQAFAYLWEFYCVAPSTPQRRKMLQPN